MVKGLKVYELSKRQHVATSSVSTASGGSAAEAHSL